MVCKTGGSVSIMENRNCHECLGTKLVLRCNNSRQKSEANFHSTHKNECRQAYQINTLSTLGIRALRKERNAVLKLLAILNLDKPVSHVTQAKNTEKLVETSSEVTDSNMEMAAKKYTQLITIIAI